MKRFSERGLRCGLVPECPRESVWQLWGQLWQLCEQRERFWRSHRLMLLDDLKLCVKNGSVAVEITDLSGQVKTT